VLLQEVFKSSDKQLFFEQLGEQYEFIDTEDMIREPNHILIGGLLGDRKSGLITLLKKTSDWEVKNNPDSPRFHEFTSHPDWLPYIWQGDRLANKGLLQVTIEKGEEQITLFNTHLQANYGSQGEHHEIRTQQIMESLSLTNSNSNNSPVILAGDINVKPVCMNGETHCSDVENYNLLANSLLDLTATLRGSEKCQNTYQHAHAEDPDCFTRIREVGSTWIDYVFISPDYGKKVTHQLQILKNIAPDHPYSDHNGLYLALYE
jgi:exonuclease III